MNWEKCLIGSVLTDPAILVDTGELVPSDFTGANQILWGEALDLHSRNALGARSLTEALRTNPDFRRYSDIGTPEEYIADMLSFRGNEPAEYIRHVLDSSIKRALQRSASLIAAEARGDDRTAEDLLDYSEKQILGLRRNRIDTGITMRDLMSVFIPRLHDIRNDNFQPSWTPALGAVKSVIQFAEKSDFIIIAGRPGDGKSSYMRYEALKHVQKGGKAIIFNLENDELEYARNFISLQTGIDSMKLKDAKKLSEAELEQIRVASQALARLPLSIKTAPGSSVSEITRIARKFLSENPAALVMVDYVQLMRNGIESKVQDVSASTVGLRALALQMGSPVFVASQLSRGIEGRGANAEPMLSDLRDSGTIEQDATTIMFVRHAWNNPSDTQLRTFAENINGEGLLFPRPKAVPVRFYVRKNRNGETGTSEYVKWTKSTGNYQTLVRGSLA